MATLTTTVTESVVLNGALRGNTNSVTTEGINNVFQRIETSENSQEAKTFEQHSEINKGILEAECEEASKEKKCKAYKDWFTFNRWVKQGFVVNKGEHGTKITVLVPTRVRVDPATGLKMTPEEMKLADSRGEAKFSAVTKLKRNVSCVCRHQVRQDVEAADRMMNRKNNKRKAASLKPRG